MCVRLQDTTPGDSYGFSRTSRTPSPANCRNSCPIIRMISTGSQLFANTFVRIHLCLTGLTPPPIRPHPFPFRKPPRRLSHVEAYDTENFCRYGLLDH